MFEENIVKLKVAELDENTALKNRKTDPLLGASRSGLQVLCLFLIHLVKSRTKHK